MICFLTNSLRFLSDPRQLKTEAAWFLSERAGLKTGSGQFFCAPEQLKTARGYLKSAAERLKTASGWFGTYGEQLKTARRGLKLSEAMNYVLYEKIAVARVGGAPGLATDPRQVIFNNRKILLVKSYSGSYQSIFR